MRGLAALLAALLAAALCAHAEAWSSLSRRSPLQMTTASVSGFGRAASAVVIGLGLLGQGQLVLADNELPEGIVGVRYPDADDVAASVPAAAAAQSSSGLPVVPLYTKKSGDTTSYSDIGRGFKLLRPFGFNEFEGAGGGYLVKFSSLFDVDENVVVGSAPATAGKTSITQYGELRDLGEKLAKKKGGELLEATARSTEGIDYYAFKFSSPLDLSLPRPGSKSLKPEKLIELYQLCVSKGRLWSVSATSNDKLFEQHSKYLNPALASFVPRL